MKHQCSHAAGTLLMCFAALLTPWSLSLCAQAPGPGGTPGTAKLTTLDRLNALHLDLAEGAVPVIYSAGAKSQALRFQKAVSDCVAW